MRVGDKVRVVAGGGQEDFFDDGCVGILTEPSGERGWWVDFNTQENAPGTFCPDSGGIWAVSEHNLVLVSDEPSSHEIAQLQARVAELEAALAAEREVHVSVSSASDDELTKTRDALRRLEVSANSVAYCYSKRPENFAGALQSLRDDAAAARKVLGQ